MNDTDEKVKREIWESFTELKHVFLATTDGNQPRVRPVTLIHLLGKLFVATGSNDAKIRQIKQNSKAEFCLLLEEGEQKGTIRAECTANIVTDKTVKARLYEKVPFMKEFWKTPEDPGYTLINLQPICFEYMKPGTIQSTKIEP